MTIQDYKNRIESETGLKVTTLKNKKGSMKGFVTFQPKRVNGTYPKFDFDYVQGINREFGELSASNNTIISLWIGNEIFN